MTNEKMQIGNKFACGEKMKNKRGYVTNCPLEIMPSGKNWKPWRQWVCDAPLDSEEDLQLPPSQREDSSGCAYANGLPCSSLCATGAVRGVLT